MSSYRRILYHIVFRTKCSLKAIAPSESRELYAYILGFLKNRHCFVYRINGMEDHIHILCDLNPTIALADLIRDLKTTTSVWMKRSGKFPYFTGWFDGYAAMTYSWRDKDRIVEYIRNQQVHHKKWSFEEELRKLLTEQGIEINMKYFP